MATSPSLPLLSGLVKEAGVISERTLIDAVAGEPVRGSWWGHPKGHAIFRALEALRDDRDVFLCKLLDGKQTYVHRRLWPALLRVQGEPSLWPPLSPQARRLLARVMREKGVQATGALRLELERSLRVVARSVHTASGAHAVVLSEFGAHFTRAQRQAAARLTLQEAQAALAPEEGPKSARAQRRRVLPLRTSAGRARERVRPKVRR
jgi:hypothetical protein